MDFEEVFSFENLKDCARACLKGVTWKQSTQTFEMDMLQWVASLHRDLLDGKYRSKGFHKFQINDRGKTRNITSVHISERCVQKCLVQYALKPLILPKLIYDNGATIENKGTDFAIMRLREHLRWHMARYGLKGGILTIDYHNYFGSIRHDILLDKLRNIIDDDRIYDLSEYFIRCFDGDIGIGLGSEISQICAVFYPNDIDHMMKDKLKVHGYGRYMDDSYIISDDISCLKEYLKIITDMSNTLGLEINPKRTQIVKFDGGHFSYLKKRIFMTDTHKIVMRLSRENITKRRRLIGKQNRLIDGGHMPIESQQMSFNSWKGHAIKYDSYKSIEALETELITVPNIHTKPNKSQDDNTKGR